MISSAFLPVFLSSLMKLSFASEPMAIFYENQDKSGKSVNYFEETDNYGHMQSVVNRRELSGIALLCATGVFLLYNQEEFDSDSDEEVRIFAGKGSCVPPGSVKSILFAQSYSSSNLDSITVFNSERFGGGIPLKITAQTQNNEANLMLMGRIGSFILMGKSEWTITTRYRTFCVKPGHSSEYPICPVPYSNALLFVEELNWLSAKRGCNDPGSTTISLPYCFNHGSGKLEPISIGESTPTSLGESTVPTKIKPRTYFDGSPIFEKCENANDELTMLLRLRLTLDLDSLYQVQFPLNKAHSWRTEILDYTIEIVNICIVDDLVHRTLLRYIREMYIYLAEKILWAEEKAWPSKPRQRQLVVAHETSRCMTHMIEKQWVAVAIKLSEEILKNMETPGIKDKDIDPELMPVKGYDFVMEFIWLSINYVGAACHAALEYETDFWMDYMNVAYDMYLRPMAEYWGKPEMVLDYYPIILGGFGLERQHKGLAAATTALYRAVTLDILPRPADVNGTRG